MCFRSKPSVSLMTFETKFCLKASRDVLHAHTYPSLQVGQVLTITLLENAQFDKGILKNVNSDLFNRVKHRQPQSSSSQLDRVKSADEISDLIVLTQQVNKSSSADEVERVLKKFQLHNISTAPSSSLIQTSSCREGNSAFIQNFSFKLRCK